MFIGFVVGKIGSLDGLSIREDLHLGRGQLGVDGVLGGDEIAEERMRRSIRGRRVVLFVSTIRVRVRAAELDVDGVFVVDETAYARERRVEQTLAVVERTLLGLVGQRTRVGQKGHVVDQEVATAFSIIYHFY